MANYQNKSYHKCIKIIAINIITKGTDMEAKKGIILKKKK